MEICRTSAELAVQESLRVDKPLVLVPTMGALHEGHLSLVRLGCKLGPVVVSIFVNPTQFGAGEDFDAYPRTFEVDSKACAEAGIQAIYAPTASGMYSKDYSTCWEIGAWNKFH